VQVACRIAPLQMAQVMLASGGMLWMLALVFLFVWVVGVVSHFTIGGLIHVLFLAAIVVVIYRIFRKHRTV
jgi:uncharacterized protein DUF5670